MVDSAVRDRPELNYFKNVRDGLAGCLSKWENSDLLAGEFASRLLLSVLDEAFLDKLDQIRRQGNDVLHGVRQMLERDSA